MEMNKKNINIPNILSVYRLFVFPVILGTVVYRVEQLFVILLVINLVTDVLDGLLARLLDQETELGARLDSIADFGTYVMAISGIFVFRYAEIAPYLTSFLVFVGLFFASYLFSLLKFGRFPSLHLYSWKIGGYIQGVFFFVLFVNDFYPALYYVMVTWGILAFSEHLVIQFMLPEMRSNQKGLYWLIRNRK
jgi:CDP-diacylglycerol--glycerol-3-phosphate 3-phosphatidyltransferase